MIIVVSIRAIYSVIYTLKFSTLDYMRLMSFYICFMRLIPHINFHLDDILLPLFTIASALNHCYKKILKVFNWTSLRSYDPKSSWLIGEVGTKFEYLSGKLGIRN